MDRGVWWATVHGAAKSWTELSDQHFQVSKKRKKRKTTCLLFLHLLSLGHFLLNSIMEDEELTLSLLLSFYTPFSSLHRIFQSKILEWIVVSFSRGSSWPRDQTWVSCIAGRFFPVWAIGKSLKERNSIYESVSHTVMSNSLWPHEL